MESGDVLLLTTEKETASAVRTALESGSLSGTTNVCKTMAELRARLAKPGAAKTRGVAVVDIDDNPQQILFDLSKVIATRPGMFFVVVSREFNEKLVLQAMQAGARHFLRKSAIAAELGTVLERLLGHEPEAATRPGDVISVFSCSGGCGATTVAVNLANELRLAPPKPVLLIDLDPHYGAAAAHLGVGGKYGIAHVLNRPGAIDGELIESSAIRYAQGLDMLLSPATAQADTDVAMNYENLLRMLEACRESYGYVVVDAPRAPRPVVADLASVSQIAVIVFQLSVRDVSYAKSLVSLLTERGMARDRILPIANRVKKRGPLLRVVDTQRAIEIKPIYCVRSDWRKAIRSLNRGQPLAHTARRSGLRRDFQKIAAQVQRWTSNGHPGKGGS